MVLMQRVSKSFPEPEGLGRVASAIRASSGLIKEFVEKLERGEALLGLPTLFEGSREANFFRKQKRINIRMSERDLKKIRAKAVEEGIPYQSLISMLIHKYNEGKLSFNP
jgi:hypothetical protein